MLLAYLDGRILHATVQAGTAVAIPGVLAFITNMARVVLFFWLTTCAQ
jgi:hypothetical protein